MDLYRALQDLYAEKEKLERAIESLEQLQHAKGVSAAVHHQHERRGRKSMSLEEREKVSERMKRYWAARRSAKREQTQPAAKASSKDRRSGLELE
ncbi:MAG: hypothetical protein ABSH45_05855 [Bryobacteraceae bacterium]|jgi:hypothetical protein